LNHQQTIQHFREIFAVAAEYRKGNEALVAHPLGVKYGRTVPQWHLFEMQEMLTEINRLRQAEAKEPITSQQLYDAEISACGHIDYAMKLAIYSAELTEAK
jgi:hypothetical protein